MTEVQFVESWLGTCKTAHNEPHRSLCLLKIWVVDYRERRLGWDAFWLKRDMDEKTWQELRAFIVEAFKTWNSCRARLVLCKECAKDKVSFKFSQDPRSFSESTKEMVLDVYCTALDALRAVN